MARKPKQPPTKPEQPDAPQKRLPVQKLLPVSAVINAPATTIELQKLNDIASLLWFPEGLKEDEKNAKIIKAIDLFESIKPADGIEAMLAAQMVGTHHAVLECLRRAMLGNQTFEGRNAALSHAQRLMSLYTQQLGALDKHRGKGQQKITVERVEVAAGGQAIVGNVQAPARHTATPAAQPAALEPPREDTVALPPARTRAKVKR